MKTFSTLVVAFFICTLAFGQTKKADRLFEKWQYAEAAEKYQAAVKKDPSPENYYRLGQCYQKMFRYSEAVEAYDHVKASGTFNQPDFYLNYGLMLKANERYTEAQVAFAKYTELAPNDPRGKVYLNSIDVVRDDLSKPMGVTVTNVSSLNNEDAAFSPVMYNDGIVYASNSAMAAGGKTFPWTGKSYLDLFYAKRGSSDTEFGKGSSFDNEINTKYHDGPASFTKNGDTIYFNRVSRDLKGAEKRTLGIERSKIYYAVKKENGEWDDAEAFPYNSNEYGMFTPFVTADGSRLYFASDMPGGMGETDIYYCVRQGDGWSSPINLGANVNTIGREQYPSLDADGNLYFSSDGYMGYGGLDICVAKAEGKGFGQAAVLKAPLNSAHNDYGMTFLKSGKSGYLSSNRVNGMGDADIYYFNIDKDSLPCEVNTTIYVMGFECPKKEEVADARPKIDSVVVVDVNPSGMMINPIYFDFDKSDIRSDAISSLNNIASIMQAHPEWYLQVAGNADSRGSSEYNIALSQRRANAAVKYLASKGINSSRIKTQAYGESRLKNGCSDGVNCSEAEHQLNRRVEFTLSLRKDIVSKR